jgi:hypothetical protein
MTALDLRAPSEESVRPMPADPPYRSLSDVELKLRIDRVVHDVRRTQAEIEGLAREQAALKGDAGLLLAELRHRLGQREQASGPPVVRHLSAVRDPVDVPDVG